MLWRKYNKKKKSLIQECHLERNHWKSCLN